MPRDFFGELHYTLHEVADMLGVSYITVKRYRARGTLNGTKVGKNVWVSETEIKDLLKNGKRK